MTTLERVYEAAQRGEHADLVVRCGASETHRSFALNAAVVAAECGYFRTMLSTAVGPIGLTGLTGLTGKGKEASVTETSLVECDPDLFALVVRCIYTGTLKPDGAFFTGTDAVAAGVSHGTKTVSRALDVLALAVFLDCGTCERLATRLIADQRAMFDPDTAVHVWLESNRIGARDMRRIAASRIASTMPRAARSAAFLAMAKPDLVDLLSSDELSVRTEVHVAEALCAWCEANGEQCTALDSRVVRLVWNDPAPRNAPGSSGLNGLNGLNGILVLRADDTRFRFLTAGHEWTENPVPDLMARGAGAAVCRIDHAIFVFGGSRARPVEKHTLLSGPSTGECSGLAGLSALSDLSAPRAPSGLAGLSAPRAPPVPWIPSFASAPQAPWVPYDYCATRSEVSCATIGSCVYVVGGVSGLRPCDHVDVFDAASGLKGATRMSRARRMCVAAETNGSLLVAGGFDSIGSPLANAEFVRPRTGTAGPAPMLEPRAAAAHATVGADVYVAGGIGAHHEPVRSAEYFNAATHEWVALPPMPRPRAFCAGAALGLTFYVFGGTERGRSTSSAFALDLTALEWTEVPAPTMGECSATVVLSGA